jgi:uncharacterized protein YjbJ (UPF0337 family)
MTGGPFFSHQTSVEISFRSTNWERARPAGVVAQSRANSGASNDTGELVMNWDRIEGDWKQFKGRVKEKWGNLTDDDLDRVAGRREQLEGLIQERYGVAKDQVRKDVDTWLDSV